jgi:hypothetical protein
MLRLCSMEGSCASAVSRSASLTRNCVSTRSRRAYSRVPTVEEEDARCSHRERQRLIRERTAHINRIKGLLLMLVRALIAVDRGDRHVCSIVRSSSARRRAGSGNPSPVRKSEKSMRERRNLGSTPRIPCPNTSIRSVFTRRARRLTCRSDAPPIEAEILFR